MRISFGSSVQGAAHIRMNQPCQDWHEICDISNPEKHYTILAVADGHGSSSCPYSADGARMACRVFRDLLKEYCDSYDADALRLFLSREKNRVAKDVDLRWKEEVRGCHERNMREPMLADGADMENLYVMYGCTLLGVLVANGFTYAFQLGDGDIVHVDEKGASHVIEGDKFLGVETYSLASTDAWKKAHSHLSANASTEQCLYLLATDGMMNSHVSREEFYRTCRDYCTMFHDGEHREIEQHLDEWLSETSEAGCGDDITAVLCYDGQSDDCR